MTTQQTQQALDQYLHALLNHGDFASHFSEDVVVAVEGTDQRFTGRNAARNWITAARSLGEVKLHRQFTGEATRPQRPSSSGKTVDRSLTRSFTILPLARSQDSDSISRALFSRAVRQAISVRGSRTAADVADK